VRFRDRYELDIAGSAPHFRRRLRDVRAHAPKILSD
jgi:hypothetical protein